MAKRKAKRKPRQIKVVPETMPEEPNVSKTQMVKDYLTENPQSTNKEIVEALAQQGVDISPAYVSMIKGKLRPREPQYQPEPSHPTGDVLFQSQLRAERDRLQRRLNAINELIE